MFDTLFGAEMPLAVRFFLAFLIVLGLIGVDRLGGAPVRRRPARRRQCARPPAAPCRDRLRQRRRPPPAHSGAARQCRAFVDDRRPDRRRRRTQYRARGRSAARPRQPSGRRHRSAAARHSAARERQRSWWRSWPLQPEPAGVGRPRRGLSLRRKNCPDRSSPPPNRRRGRSATRLRRWPTNSPHGLRHRRAIVPPPRVRCRTSRSWNRRSNSTRAPDEPRAEPPRKPVAPACPADCRSTAAGAAGFSRARDGSRIHARSKPGRHGATSGSSVAQADHRKPPAGRWAAGADAAEGAPPRMPRPAESKAARPEAKPNQGKTTPYDSLEQEMASLLGRPTKP